MAELTTIARPYAKAAFLHAQETGALEKWESMLQLAAAVVRDGAMRAALEAPQRGAGERARLMIEVCGEELDEGAQNFIHQLSQNKRLSLLPVIAQLFHRLMAAQQRFQDVEVTSAFELEDGETQKLSDSLKQRLGMEVNVSTSVDDSLIGGVLVRAGDTVIDGSVRGRLNRLAERLNSRV